MRLYYYVHIKELAFFSDPNARFATLDKMMFSQLITHQLHSIRISQMQKNMEK